MFNSKFVIEVKTNRNGWTRAILLDIKSGNYVIQLKSGDIIRRSNMNGIKFDKVKKIKSKTKDYQKGKYKHMKRKKIKKVKKDKDRFRRKKN
jgi:5-hydroxyisourate hydrolase-like protein (transthyretin family)